MYLTGRERALVADIFKVLAGSHSEHELRSEVGWRLLDLLQADYLGLYGSGLTPDYKHHYPYRGSPMPRRQHRRSLLWTTGVMLRDELAASEVFDDLQRHDGPDWGLTLFAWTDGERIGDLCIWRGQHRDNFSDHELALLELVRPAFTVALARARTEAQRAKPESVPAPARSDDAFARLTRREREVVELIIEGLLDKEIAQRLGISYTTVRTHVDRSFQKLGVSNRSRLARVVRTDAR